MYMAEEIQVPRTKLGTLATFEMDVGLALTYMIVICPAPPRWTL